MFIQNLYFQYNILPVSSPHTKQVNAKILISLAAGTAAKSLQSCPTLCDPIRGQPTRLPRPWGSPEKNTVVGCHCLLYDFT